MAAEVNAHHVVDLALVPVSRAPDADDGRQFGFFLAHVGFKPQFAAAYEAAQMINDRPARVFAVIVHTAHVHEIIETQLLFGEFTDFDDALGVADLEGDFAAKFRRFGDDRAKLGF